MKLSKATMSLRQAMVLYVLYGVAAMLWAQRMPDLIRRWGVVRHAAVDVRAPLSGMVTNTGDTHAVGLFFFG
jgi:hypothetical protein